MTDWFSDLLVVVCLVLLALPPRYDPAIRWKEWMEREDGQPMP